MTKNATIEKLLTRTRAAADQRAASTREKYRALVEAAGRGEELDPDGVVEFLDAANIDAAEFQDDVETHAKRLEWKAEADQIADRQTKLAKVEQAIAAAANAYEAAIATANEKRAAAMAPLAQQEAALKAGIKAAEQAEQKLADPEHHPHPDRVEALTAARKRHKAASEALGNARGHIQKSFGAILEAAAAAEKKLYDARQHARHVGTGSGKTIWMEQAEEAVAQTRAAISEAEGVQPPAELVEAVKSAERELAAAEKAITLP